MRRIVCSLSLLFALLLSSAVAAAEYPKYVDTFELNGTLGFRFDGSGEAGSTVSGAGDVNGDGYDDAIICSPSPPGPSDENLLVLFGGGKAFPAIIDPAFVKEPRNGLQYRTNDVFPAKYGYGVGDINGDGYGDFSVSGYSTGYILFGQPLPWQGGDTFLEIPHHLRIRTGPWGIEGLTISYIGDVNGDGLDDFGFYIHESSNFFGLLGREEWPAFLNSDTMQLGDPGLFRVLGYPIGGSEDRAEVVHLGDVNGDGLDDFGIGMPAASGLGRNRSGVVHVIYGRTEWPESIDLYLEPDANSGFVLIGEQTRAAAGHGLTGLGDINDDGLSDFGFGSPFWSHEESLWAEAGWAHCYYGSTKAPFASDILNNPGFFSLTAGPQKQVLVGGALAGGTSFLRPQAQEILVGIPAYPQFPPGTGLVQVWGGASEGQHMMENPSEPIIEFSTRLQGNSRIGGDLDSLGEFDAYFGQEIIISDRMGPGASVVFSPRPPHAFEEISWKSTSTALPMRVRPASYAKYGSQYTPNCRMWLRWILQSGATQEEKRTASRETVTLLSRQNGVENLPDAARVVWRLESDRQEFDAVELQVKYMPHDVSHLIPDTLELMQAPSPEGPWEAIPVQYHDSDRRRLGAFTETLGYFAIRGEPKPPAFEGFSAR